ncbi:NAD-dependent epimerase/dehydratase family protein [Halobellus rubicundus]|uniref:NAD-dependent epimerase/dehydratase family protein n=1 Tax=Halobellus rubicundus TaxID=2996466 RepID=A0ABD5MEB1_9EURY
MSERLLSGQTIAITGGAGFIGSHIAEVASDRNHVTVFDNLSSGYEANIPEDVDFVHRDVGSISASDFADTDIVFHEAANVSITQSVDNPEYDAKENIIGLIRVLEAAKNADVERVVTASSSSVYGSPERFPQREIDRQAPESPYAAGKLSGEYYCQVYRELHDLETICLRYFNVYGPRQRNDSPYSGVISIFLDRATNGQSLIIHGTGEQTRDFIFVEDVVRANIRAATVDLPERVAYNVGTGTETSISELADAVESVTDRSLEREFDSRRSGDVDRSVAAVTNAAEELGFSSRVSLEEGLERTLQWHQRDS